MIDSRLLRHVVALADAGSFSRAADAIGISQPALSRSIASLEKLLNLRLFDRDPRRVVPTAAGQTFVREARSILAHTRSLEQQLFQWRTTELGEVNFGCGPGLAAAAVPALLQRIARERPRLMVQVMIQSADAMLRALHGEQIEFFAAAAILVPADERREREIIGTFKTGMFVRIGHALDGRKQVPRDDILAYPVIAGAPPAEFGREMAEPVIKPTITCENYHILVETVLNSDAILLGTIPLAQRLAPGKLVEVDFADDEPEGLYSIAIVRLKGRTLSPASLLLKNLLAECLVPG